MRCGVIRFCKNDRGFDFIGLDDGGPDRNVTISEGDYCAE
jgi:hypothetical protein